MDPNTSILKKAEPGKPFVFVDGVLKGELGQVVNTGRFADTVFIIGKNEYLQSKDHPYGTCRVKYIQLPNANG